MHTAPLRYAGSAARAAMLVVASAAALAVACDPPPYVDDQLCGNGVVDESEDATTCCEDTGCPFGRCGRLHRCDMPWPLCADDGACIADHAPYVCAGREPPPTDCMQCGCPGSAACTDGVCMTAAERDAARALLRVPADLNDTDYAALLSDLAAADGAGELVPLDVLTDSIATQIQADPRTSVLAVATTGGGLDAALTAALQQAVAQTAITDTRTVFAVSGDALWPVPHTAPAVDDAALCSTVADPLTLASTLFTTAVTGPAHHAVPCMYRGAFAQCRAPTLSACVEAAGMLTIPVLLLDAAPALDVLDDALLRRAGRTPPDALDALLQTSITFFRGQADALPFDAAFGTTLEDEAVDVRVWLRPEDAVVFIPRPGASPRRLLSYRVVWLDAPAQAFLVAHDIQTADCAIDPSAAAAVTLVCGNAAATLQAVVDSTTLTLVDVSTSGG